MEKLKLIQSYKYGGSSPNKVTKRAARAKPKAYSGLRDLAPSLKPNLQVVFIGFNPGVASSATQHHYAHHSNLFWKLFNQSRVLFKVLDRLQIDYKKAKTTDPLLAKLIVGGKSVARPEHDNELLQYSIGFTDLVLRCTKSAQELSVKEKLENVPRLLEEFRRSTPKNIVVVGKGIWEIIVKYIQGESSVSSTQHFKDFQWGLLEDEAVIDWLSSRLGYEFKLYVWPNTSGLAASMKYDAKLQLWNSLMED